MILAVRRGGIILMVAEDMHFRPALREAALAAERGEIGEQKRAWAALCSWIWASTTCVPFGS